MANFGEHIRYGWVSHLIVSIVAGSLMVVKSYPVELAVAIIGISLPLTLFASVLPDIDHHSSNTNSLFKYGLFVSTTVLVGLTIGQYSLTVGLLWLTLIPVVNGAIVFGTICFSSILSGTLVTKAFSYARPVHRGFTHTVSFALTVSLVAFVATWQVNQVTPGDETMLGTSLIISAYFLTGVLTHLRVDGTLLPSNILSSGKYKDKL